MATSTEKNSSCMHDRLSNSILNNHTWQLLKILNIFGLAMYQTHAIQSIQIVLLLINEQGVKKGYGIWEGFVLREKWCNEGEENMVTAQWQQQSNAKKTNKTSL
jgi:hypothetical protein